MARFIGIRHRVKMTTAGEVRPTQLCIVDGDKKPVLLNLENEQDEMDFLRGRFPIAWREPRAFEEDLTAFWPHHLQTRALKKDETLESIPEQLRVKRGKKTLVITKVPESYEGFRAGDRIALSMGGSGQDFGSGLSRRAEQLGGDTGVYWLPPKDLKDNREDPDGDKDEDAELLANLLAFRKELFYKVEARERHRIELRGRIVDMFDTMRDRIKCQQRLRRRLIGAAFRTEEGLWPEGQIEDIFADAKANHPMLVNLQDEEGEEEKVLSEVLDSEPVYQRIFAPMGGCGVRIAARLIVAIGDIRRFEVKPDPKALADINAEIKDLLDKGKYYEDKPAASASFPANHTGVDRVIAVRKYKLEHDKLDEASTLQLALMKMQERKGLWLRANSRSLNKFKAYCGLHLVRNPKTGEGDPAFLFPRRRHGVVCNWNPMARQAAYLMMDQANKRPDTEWGQRLRDNKVRLRVVHPEPIKVKKADDKVVTRFSNGHIHKMGIWRTATRWAEEIFKEWMAFDRETDARQADAKDKAA